MSTFDSPSPSEFPSSGKASRVLNIRKETKQNPTPKSKSRSRMDALKTDSSLHEVSDKSGMSMYELNKDIKKLQDEYFKNLNLDQKGGRKRKTSKRKKNKKSHKPKRKNKKSKRRRKSSRRRH